MKTTYSASVICMNPLKILDDVKLCEENSIDSLHIDIMDGKYVPRYGLYPEIIQEISNNCNLTYDLHLMVNDIKFTLEQFLPCPNVTHASFHVDQNYGKIFDHVDLIKNYGIGVGLVVNLCSSIDYVSQTLESYNFDSIMFMCIKHGVLSQDHRSEIVINHLNILTERTQLPSIVQCDGGVNFESIKNLSEAGVNNFICGTSTIFKDINNSDSFDQRKATFRSNVTNLFNILP